MEKANNEPVIPLPYTRRIQRTTLYLTKEWGIVAYHLLRLKKCGRIELHVNNGAVNAVAWVEGPRDEK